MNSIRRRHFNFLPWVATVAAAMVMAACGKNAGPQNSEVASKQYPGYQQVGGSGDAAQLWFNPTDISRSGSSYLIHALKAFPQGYARFDVATNCRDTTRRQAGTQYRADGTAEQEYPGNDAAVPAKSEPGMTELMTTACGVAMASRSIAGDFSAPAALELLYGPYDESSKTASWTDASVPADLPWRDNLQFAPGKVLAVTSMAIFNLTEGGKEKKVFVTNAVPDGGGCHACTGLLGVAVFTKDGNNWKVESNNPYVASMGAMGSVGSHFEWAPAGDDTYALVIGGDDMHQGYQTASITAFIRGKDGAFSPAIDDSDTGASDQETISTKTTFIKGKNAAHYDVKVAFSYSLPGQAAYIADHVYQYAGGKYVLVKKDDPPKFVQTAGDVTSVDTSANVSPAALQAPQRMLPPSTASLAPSFDCSKARSDAEHLICSDPELASDDVALASIFVMAKAAVVDQTGFKERVRRQWNYREQNCHDRECLLRWYADQKAALSQIAQTGRLD
ncbi:hypothetical protein [Paraburkholderia sp. BL17N1]|uniref:lysozyme inhibitor LprI family protein n=1 Tax=Paraburkholderia sp. BL17N1 TaxID=1938798 RepID=UPI000F1F0148|nr:hypothetical protein [Paraburkholderia sp. BL17N1]RKR36205.1 hypothetical protein B0G82_4239 [Paraburkholderia sp. BL17N1]